MRRLFSRGLLALYLVLLIWLILFKLQYNILSVFHYQHRSLNWVPFADHSIESGNYREMVDNIIIFIPLGLLLNVNFKEVRFFPKLAFIMALSLTFEFIQLIFAIGATDITDIITNTFGGFLGLKLYDVSNKYLSNKKLDRIIIFAGILLLVIMLYFRTHLIIMY
ncbi:glycopeptide resistance protein VanZ-A [Halobacillus rhizosphaerae]|uniref:glycopeptide resistance protein VanZ-A n=1 Tax=Halobacillus rhizosphaerae TaxID=3064889 RepID=UPI00398AE212